MDLFLMILRFLIGMPANADEVESIVVHADGRTSGGRQWLATQRSIQNTIGVPTPWQTFLRVKPDSSDFWNRLSYYSREEPRSRFRCQNKGPTSRT